MREAGLDALGALRWGSHCCQLYRGKEDLLDTVVPWLEAGLRANEACAWIAAAPLAAAEAREALVRALPGAERALASGQLEIRDAREWYAQALSDPQRLIESWLERERRALERGYEGLRLVGGLPRPDAGGWRECMDYESRLDAAFRARRILTLCTYCAQDCGAHEVVDLVRCHHAALARRGSRWEAIESAARRTRELEEALRSRDQFLAMLAHELRSPLAPIRTAAQLVQLVAAGDASLASAGEVLDRQVAQLSRLVDELLDGARIAQGVITLRKELVALDSLVTRALEAAQARMAESGLSLAFSLAGEPLHVQADPTRLLQLLGNLLDNAAKFTPAGGRVEVSVRREERFALLRVKDTGTGIPGEMLARIFDVFTQVEPALDRPKGGLGIGLALVRRLAEMHGGSVEALSEGRGQGAEFVVRLPLAAPARAALPVPRRALGAPRRILVVDDNADAASTLAATLRLLGHEVRTADSGGSALRAARDFRPEVVLLDIGLPGMDGYEVARCLRRLPATRRARLVALTGHGHEDDRRKGREAGFDEYRLKPISPDALHELLSAPSVH